MRQTPNEPGKPRYCLSGSRQLRNGALRRALVGGQLPVGYQAIPPGHVTETWGAMPIWANWNLPQWYRREAGQAQPFPGLLGFQDGAPAVRMARRGHDGHRRVTRYPTPGFVRNCRSGGWQRNIGASLRSQGGHPLRRGQRKRAGQRRSGLPSHAAPFPPGEEGQLQAGGNLPDGIRRGLAPSTYEHPLVLPQLGHL